jgi:hypothetical protein
MLQTLAHQPPNYEPAIKTNHAESSSPQRLMRKPEAEPELPGEISTAATD